MFNCVSLLAEGVLWILGCAIARLGQGRGAIGKWGWGSLVWDWAGCGWGCLGPLQWGAGAAYGDWGWGCLGGRCDDLIGGPKIV